MIVSQQQQIDNVLSATSGDRTQRRFLQHCIDGNTLEALARIYNNPQTIILVVNDDELPVLESVRSATETWNTTLGLFNRNPSREDLKLPLIPGIIYIGVQSSNKIASVYGAIEGYLNYAGQLDDLLGKNEIFAGRIKYHGPLPSKPVDMMPLIVHAQDLRLAGAAPGVTVMSDLEQRKLQGALPRLNFVLPWSSLSAAQPKATHPEIFTSATQFYVVPAPKDPESIQKFESYGPSLIRDVYRALAGRINPFNARSYRGPLSLFSQESP